MPPTDSPDPLAAQIRPLKLAGLLIVLASAGGLFISTRSVLLSLFGGALWLLGHTGVNLFMTLKWSFLLVLVLVALPLTAFSWMPGHALVGGIFTECSWLECLGITSAALMAGWSLLFTQSMLVLDVKARISHRHIEFPHDGEVPEGFVPEWARSFYRVPLRLPQLLAVIGLAAPTIAVVIARADSPSLAAVGSALGIVAFELVRASVLSIALLAIDPAKRSFSLLDGLVRSFTWCLERIAGLRAMLVGIRRLLALAIFRFIAPDLVRGEGPTRRLQGQHFIASVAFCGIFVTLTVLFLFFEPPREHELPPGMLVFILLMFIVWGFAALDFHLGRRGIPVLLVLLLGLLPRQLLDTGTHLYEVELAPQPALTPVDVVEANPGDNLVIVCTAGGGILSAGWTTYSLEQLVARRPELTREIRLLSGVSGGSVGSAFYVDAMRREGGTPADATRRATRSSLAAVTYGLVSRISFGASRGAATSFGLFAHDRGYYLDQSWQHTADGDAYDSDRPLRLSDLTADIERGAIPATIFNATAMESGRRVMITPLVFEQRDPSTLAESAAQWMPGGDAEKTPGTRRLPTPRAETLSEYVLAATGPTAGKLADLSLWTAARLSATFPYVTPAARADLPAGSSGAAVRKVHHHMIDGGYHDNYGVASALDFLELAMRDRLRPDTTLRFKRVAIVELRAFPPAAPEESSPVSGTVSAVAGPLIGIASIRDGTALARNATALARFVDNWNLIFARRAAAGTKGAAESIKIGSFLFQPPAGSSGPLSWHLTASDIAAFKRHWETGELDKHRDDPRGIVRQLEALEAFLDG